MLQNTASEHARAGVFQLAEFMDTYNTVPLRRATLVHADSSSYVDEFAYMASIPSGVFVNGTSRYISPILFFNQSDSQRWLLEDWVEYLDVDGGVTQFTVVGDATLESVESVATALGVVPYPWVRGGTSAEIAAYLALADWSESDSAVVALSHDAWTTPTPLTGESSRSMEGLTTVTQTSQVTVLSDNPFSVSFSSTSGVGWLEGAFNWTGDFWCTHVLDDPLGHHVDYSIRSQTYWERFSPLVHAPVPLYFWYPNTANGTWDVTITPQSIGIFPVVLDFELILHPGYTESISVPANAKSLDVTLSWDKRGTDLNLALIDPQGRLVQWAPSGSLISGPGRESVSVPYPMEGEWQVVVAWMNANGEQNNAKVSWVIERLPQDLQYFLESAANGAVLASLLNSPLLYTDAASVPEITSWVIEELDVNHIFLVDPANLHSVSVMTELSSLGVVVNLYNYPLVSQWIRQLSKSNDVVITIPRGDASEFFPAAAYSAAFHGAPVFSLCDQHNVMTTRAEATWYPYLIGPEIDIYITSRYSTRSENGWFDERIPNRYTMTSSVEAFEGFLDDRGAYNSTVPQKVVVVSPDTVIKTSFDRSIQSHFLPGRIPAATPSLAAVQVNRAALHRFIFRIAESADRALVTMYAYTHGAQFIDNGAQIHTIYQFENTSDSVQDAGLEVDAHVGYSEVFASLAAQPALWVLSTHGTLTRYPTDPPARPGGDGLFSLRSTDAEYGRESSSTRDANADKLVNPVQFTEEESLHRIESTATLAAGVGNMGSPIVILTACLLGGSMLPMTLMEHGAVSVVASPRTVYFQPAAMVSLVMLEDLASGETIGSALGHGIVQVSYDYSNPPSQDPRDYACQHVLFGDPSIMLYDPDAVPRVPAVDGQSAVFGSHVPGRGTNPVAALGTSSTLPSALTQAGVDYDYYEVDNYSGFRSLLPVRKCVILEPGSYDSFSALMAVDASALATFVSGGGVLALIGVSDDSEWLPWGASVDEGPSGLSIELTDTTHPLMTTPNLLNSSTSYQGRFLSMWENYSVLATDPIGPVIIASSVGFGKVMLSTIRPSGEWLNQFVENIALWGNQPSLWLRSISLSQVIIWGGDRVTVVLRITDRVGKPVSGVALSLRLNSSDVSDRLHETTPGQFSILLDETWTNEHVGMLTLNLTAKKAGHDTLTLVLYRFMYVRPSPWPAIAILSIGIIALFVGYAYIKRRRGETILPSWHLGSLIRRDNMTREERKRKKEEERRRREERKKKESEFDAKEFFGV
ncbi:MAG: hypothetical protein HXY34_11820 [Candidatus Thorarchaeota archaeon]|nr:hypothetical protein [Candidatus Thorarchaeota archaeon]